MSILVAMFCLGAFALLAQVTFAREMLVAFLGNEAAIAAVLGSWLVGISIGAFVSRPVLKRIRNGDSIAGLLSGFAVLLGIWLPFQVYVIRISRLLLRVPLGEYASLGSILVTAFAVFLPTCGTIGFFFPAACQLLYHRKSAADKSGETATITVAGQAVSLVYLFEAAGSMVGGVVMTFLLLPRFSTVGIVAFGSAVISGAAFVLARRGALRAIAVLLAAAAVAVGILPGLRRGIEERALNARWRGFGVLGAETAGSEAAVSKVCASQDSVYQNIAVIETDGQYAVYGNGNVLFVFPDKPGSETRIHFIMAQKPDARHVLMLGGNPAGEIPELLKYPLVELVYVELDPLIGTAIAPFTGDEYRAAASDPRVKQLTDDAIRYVRTCDSKFDVVLVNAPEPSTTAASRFYTLEFHRALRRIVAEDGFVHTSISVPERLQAESANLGASVYKTMKLAYPVVLATGEADMQLFGGTERAGLCFDGELLYRRSKAAGLKTDYFRPEYFLGADEISPEKTAFVARRLEAADVPINTNLRPASCFFNLVLWSKFSGSRTEWLLEPAARLQSGYIAAFLATAAAVCLFVGFGLSGRGHTSERRGAWSRAMIAVVVATTGCCGMALEILLLLTFQNLYGYIYARMGFVVAVFMMGLVAGSFLARAAVGKGILGNLGFLLAMELLLLLAPLSIPLLVGAASQTGLSGSVATIVESAIYFLVGFIGLAVGAEFPLANRLYCESGGIVGAAASITDATDHLGAAAGSFIAGVLLVPILGIGGSCFVLAAAKGASLLCLISAILSRGVFAAAGQR